MFSLLVAIVPALLVSLSFDYYYVYSQNMKTLEVLSEKIMERAVETLQKPLWQYDVEFLQEYAAVLCSDPSVSMVIVYDERDRDVAHASKGTLVPVETSIHWQLEREVLKESRVVGKLIIEFNNSEIQKLSRQMLVSDVLVIFSILLSVWAAIWYLVTKQVLLPLKIMKDSFHDISIGDYSKRVTLKNENELTLISREFNEMVDRVESRDKALRESEVKYRNLVESPSDIIFTTDNENRLVFINSNFEKWTGIEGETLLGKSFLELFMRTDDYRDLDFVLPQLEGDQLWERRLIKSDGTYIPVELNISIQFDSKKRVYGAIGIARDITTRMKAEEEFRKYEQMVASITDYLLLVDSSYKIQAVNKAYLDGVGKERKELIGADVLSIFAMHKFQDDFLPYFETCLQGSSVKHQTQLFVGEGKVTSYMVITFFPLFEEDNSVSGVIVHMRDITEQKKLEGMLQQSQKMEAIGTMAGGIAHDFNNIIGGIVGYAEMIEMFDAKEESKLVTRIQHVLKGAYRARELVEKILTFSRNSDSKKKPLNLDSMVSDTLQFLRASIPSTVEIVKREKCPDSFVWADETSIQQILMNLCTNAAHAMQEHGGNLTVDVCIEQIDQVGAERIDVQLLGAYVKLSIADTGVGMDANVLERIFEPFFTTKKTGEGTGMGLAMVHGIIKELRGGMVVESIPTQGSTFHLYLPQYDLVDICETEGEPLNTEIPGGRGNILIVDDEPELLGFSREILEHHGYQVTSTTNSVEARQIFLSDPHNFDLVITDQTMPNITGLELAKQFIEVRSDIKIILCTGFSQSVTKEDAQKVGIKQFVKKPYGPRQLARLVSAELKAVSTDIPNDIAL